MKSLILLILILSSNVFANKINIKEDGVYFKKNHLPMKSWGVNLGQGYYDLTEFSGNSLYLQDLQRSYELNYKIGKSITDLVILTSVAGLLGVVKYDITSKEVLVPVIGLFATSSFFLYKGRQDFNNFIDEYNRTHSNQVKDDSYSLNFRWNF